MKKQIPKIVLFLLFLIYKRTCKGKRFTGIGHNQKVWYEFDFILRKRSPFVYMTAILALPVFGLIGTYLLLIDCWLNPVNTRIYLSKSDKLKWHHGYDKIF